MCKPITSVKLHTWQVESLFQEEPLLDPTAEELWLLLHMQLTRLECLLLDAATVSQVHVAISVLDMTSNLFSAGRFSSPQLQAVSQGTLKTT